MFEGFFFIESNKVWGTCIVKIEKEKITSSILMTLVFINLERLCVRKDEIMLNLKEEAIAQGFPSFGWLDYLFEQCAPGLFKSNKILERLNLEMCVTAVDYKFS